MTEITDEVRQQNADLAMERICGMAAEGIVAISENRTLLTRVHELELESQRWRFEAMTERNLKRDAYNRNFDLHQENERLRDLVAGRIDRGPVDPRLLLRSVLDVIHAAADGEEDNDQVS